MRAFCAVVASVLAVTAGAASDRGWDVSGGVVDSDFDTGFNVAAGYVIDSGPFRVNLNFVDWNVYSGEAEGFRNETLPSGQEICRDLSNGQFADSEKCEEGEIDFAASVAWGYVFRKIKYPLLLGLGARVFGDDDLGGDNVVYGNLQLFSTDPGVRLSRTRLFPRVTQVTHGPISKVV